MVTCSDVKTYVFFHVNIVPLMTSCGKGSTIMMKRLYYLCSELADNHLTVLPEGLLSTTTQLEML